MNKRKLSKNEIEDLLNFIKPNPQIPPCTAESIVENHKIKLRKQLNKIQIYPKNIPNLKKELIRIFFDCQISPGESIGILCAQSIGEKNTQSTLNTFHKCGQQSVSVVQGVPRFQELLNATKNPKNMICEIYFKEGNSTLKDLRQVIGTNLVCLTLKDLSESINIELNKVHEKWYDSFKIVYNNNYEEHKHCLSIKLSKKKLFKYRIDIKEIADKIESSYDDLYCVFSTYEYCQLDIFVDVSNIKFTEKQLLFVTSDNAEEIYIDECVQPILEKMVVFGIPGILDLYYIQHNKTNEWYVETNGSNFKKLLGLPIIDMPRLHSNNVWDIYETIGIEAAREFLIRENVKIMEGINLCHVKLLVDKMTFTGTINSISRYTLRKDDSGVLSKCSFEESTDILIKAGFAGEKDTIKGISASIICGKKGDIGSGFMDLKININQLFKNDGIVKEEKGGNILFKSYTNFK